MREHTITIAVRFPDSEPEPDSKTVDYILDVLCAEAEMEFRKAKLHVVMSRANMTTAAVRVRP